MLQTELKVVAVGEPDLEALTDGEKRTFFESIFSRISLRNAVRLKTDKKYVITNVWDENTKAVVKNPKSEKKYSKNMCLTTYANKCNTPKY